MLFSCSYGRKMAACLALNAALGVFFFVPCWEKQIPGSESADQSQTGSKGRRGDFEGGAVINSDGLAPDPPGDRPIGGVYTSNIAGEIEADIWK